ncbi:MAG: hypothetical protein DMF54_07150 [Acidobacteria bacterium]|nr:MAG: hypothetical protein DMF54_07150 [Acidobacteriota bacterium]
MRVLVTGASGFLGSQFVNAAARRGHEVVAAVRRPGSNLDASQRIMDVFDPKPDDMTGVDAIVHFAAVTGGAPENFYRLNAQGTLRLFEVAQGSGVKRFIHVSSASVYGADGNIERRPYRRGSYAGSKTVADQLICAAAQRKNSELRTSVIRPGLVYGPGMRASVIAGAGVVAPARILVCLGPRSAHLPIVHIDDLIQVIAATLEQEIAGQLEVWDVLAPVQPRRDQVIDEFADLTGGGWTILWIPPWLMIGIGFLAGVAQTLRGRPRGLVYKIRRATKFDSARLDSAGIWQATNVRPANDLRKCLVDGLLGQPKTSEVGLMADFGSIPAQLVAIGSAHPAAGMPKRVIVVGAGGVVRQLHMPVLQRSDQWQVVAVVDPDLSAASDIARRLGGTAARSIGDLDLEIEGATIVIAAPGPHHVALAEEALRRGADVIIEKPVSTSRLEFEKLKQVAKESVVTAIQNYRLRPNVRRLWRAMTERDVGPIRRVAVEFHSGRLATERAPWTRRDEFGRTVLGELAIHFLDLACVAVGRIAFPAQAVTSNLAHDGALIRLSALGTSTSGGVPVSLSISVTGTAQRCQLTFEFERASYEVTFFPEGFRVLPIRSTPLDDLVAALSRTVSYGFDRSPMRRRYPNRDSPHALIYQDHLTRTLAAPAPASRSPFSLDGVGDTMETLFELEDILSAQATS